MRTGNEEPLIDVNGWANQEVCSKISLVRYFISHPYCAPAELMDGGALRGFASGIHTTFIQTQVDLGGPMGKPLQHKADKVGIENWCGL